MGQNVTTTLRTLAQAAPFIAELAAQYAREQGVFDLVLAGGRTARRVYSQLAAPGLSGTIPWGQVRVFLGDERFVPPDHPESNYRLARETLLAHVPLPADRVFPVPTEAPSPAEAAAAYERTLRKALAARPGASDTPFPSFDLVLLGIGPDGHTASLFPEGPECEERQRWVVVSQAPEHMPVRDRITMTLPLLNAARAVAFLAFGAEKRTILEQLLAAAAAAAEPDRTVPARPARRLLPAERVRPSSGRLLWFVDP
jgi:6-phosphogluconolactonase